MSVSQEQLAELIGILKNLGVTVTVNVLAFEAGDAIITIGDGIEHAEAFV